MAIILKNNNKHKQLEYIQRILNTEVEIINTQEGSLRSGVDINILQIFHPDLDQGTEDKAFLSFLPIEDDKRYLQLSFILEHAPNEESTGHVVQLLYKPQFFDFWEEDILKQGDPFLFDRTVEQSFAISPALKVSIPELVELCDTNKSLINEIKKHEFVLQMFRASLEAFFDSSLANKLPACKFLQNSSEQEKVVEARKVILSRLSDPITIKELSKEVGMNECYLKKGFKAMFGKTIHEYQQFERIEKAKALILQNEYLINEVAYMMGFNSHTHFSTSFKRITGMKPCELLK